MSREQGANWSFHGNRHADLQPLPWSSSTPYPLISFSFCNELPPDSITIVSFFFSSCYIVFSFSLLLCPLHISLPTVWSSMKGGAQLMIFVLEQLLRQVFFGHFLFISTTSPSCTTLLFSCKFLRILLIFVQVFMLASPHLFHCLVLYIYIYIFVACVPLWVYSNLFLDVSCILFRSWMGFVLPQISFWNGIFLD